MLKTLRPPGLPAETLSACAREAYGLAGHPAEGHAVLQCQAAALEHIAESDPALPVPRLVRSRDGAALAQLAHGGGVYPVMVLSWLEGRVLGGDTLSQQGRFELGQVLARLGVALRGFIHGAPAERDLVWDTRNILRLAPEVAHLPAADRAIAEDILARHAQVSAPALRRMRSQIIHGDVHPHNALVDAAGRISGIIDFGDMVHAPLILDLANAVGDFLSPQQDVSETIRHLVRGYRSVTPLEEAEADALIDLIDVRLLMTPLIDALKASNGIAAQGYFEAFNSRSMPMIREMRRIGHDALRGIVRRAAAFPATPPVHARTADDAITRRRKVMGDKLYVFYDPPLHIVKGKGVWLTASDGRR